MSPKQEIGLQFILLNEKKREILSFLPVEEVIKENLSMTEYFKEIFEGNVFSQQYVFPTQLPVNGFPYVLRFGYAQNQFYILFLKQTYWPFLLVCSCLCLFAFFSYFYHAKLMKTALRFYKQKNRENTLKIDQLTAENHRSTGREKILEKYINLSEEAARQEKRFCLDINKRISHSLSKMLDIANFLLNRIQEENNIKEDSKELMEVFENTYIHSRFFTLKTEEELVSVNDVVDEALVVLSKQILKKELHIKYTQEKVVALLTDRTALKQAILNVLGRAIKNSPKKGEVILTLVPQENTLCLECKDSGYLGDSPLNEQIGAEEKLLSLDCLSLEREDMEKLVKSLGGTLSILHEPYKGNAFVLQLPYKTRKERGKGKGKITTTNDNIVSFSSLKKKR
ncbi:MAG: HAMP domain-containing histidine kinase [Alphaproteobacteria bacterium]|nr:HAMP domain-containing histidine kinase [Alphaproteobacteria bacterium]